MKTEARVSCESDAPFGVPVMIMLPGKSVVPWLRKAMVSLTVKS